MDSFGSEGFSWSGEPAVYTHTYTAKTDTISLAVLDIDKFHQVVHDIKRDETNLLQKYLRSVPLFSSLAPNLARKLSAGCQEQFFNRG